jgi:hypothetical protein
MHPCEALTNVARCTSQRRQLPVSTFHPDKKTVPLEVQKGVQLLQNTPRDAFMFGCYEFVSGGSVMSRSSHTGSPSAVAEMMATHTSISRALADTFHNRVSLLSLNKMHTSYEPHASD